LGLWVVWVFWFWGGFGVGWFFFVVQKNAAERSNLSTRPPRVKEFIAGDFGRALGKKEQSAHRAGERETGGGENRKKGGKNVFPSTRRGKDSAISTEDSWRERKGGATEGKRSSI